MQDYRLYLLNQHGGFASVRELPASADGEAVRAAAALDHRHGVEIWSGGRKVGSVKGASAH